MKKIISVFIILSVLLSCTSFAEGYYALGQDSLTAECAILMDAHSGRVIYEKNSVQKHAIASITKIMTALVVFDEIYKGNLTLDTIVTANGYEPEEGEVHIYLAKGEQISVHDLLKAMFLPSANDACVALAEHIAGSKKGFVEMMNNKAIDLKLENTNFSNTNGLKSDNHYSTAHDVAVMARALLNYKEVYNYCSLWNDSIRGGTFQVTNTNLLLTRYDGMTGLKTGYTEEAGYCLAGTAERNGVSLISVVLGAPTSDARFADTKAILNYGFDNYEMKTIARQGEPICDIKLKRAVEKKYTVTLSQDYTALMRKDFAGEIEKNATYEEKIKAPIEQGMNVGSVTFSADGMPLMTVPLTVQQSFPKITYFTSIGLLFKSFMGLR
ncbi:MAG: D-alanyl-D-alanine carboxypeptidase [Clostridia bacterium]|nr:D-alanyl-D-alanine carboxypeptidase [Clostridia bacterium]